MNAFELLISSKASFSCCITSGDGSPCRDEHSSVENIAMLSGLVAIVTNDEGQTSVFADANRSKMEIIGCDLNRLGCQK